MSILQTRDMVTVDVQNRLIKMEVDDNELQERQKIGGLRNLGFREDKRIYFPGIFSKHHRAVTLTF